MSTITTERLTKILSETQAEISKCNSRGVHASVEVNARLFENVLMELLRHRAAILQGAEPVTTANKLPDPIKDNHLNSGPDADDYYSGYQAGWNELLEAIRGNSPVIPDGLRLALSNAGIAAPESDEMLAATCEKYIQELVTWVKERKPFKSAVLPDGWVMVPIEPTEAMMLHKSGCQHHAWDDQDCAMRQTRRLIWSHMLAAAPQQEV